MLRVEKEDGETVGDTDSVGTLDTLEDPELVDVIVFVYVPVCDTV